MDDEPIVAASRQAGPPRHRGSPAFDERQALIERDLNDVYLLMDHLSGRADRCISDMTLENSADPKKPLDLVEEVCRIRWPLPEAPVEYAKQATVLFKARDKLNQMASPANGATIAYTILVLGGASSGMRGWLASWLPFVRKPDTAHSRSDLARAAYPNLIHSADAFRRWIVMLQFMLLGGLLVTSLLSWNVASGKLILQRIAALDAEAVDIGRTLNAGDVPSAAPPAAASPSAPSSTMSINLPAYDRYCQRAAQADRQAAAENQVEMRREQTCATARLVMHRRNAADRDLDEWASYWGWLKHVAARFNGLAPDTYSAAPYQPANMLPEAARGEAIEQWSADLMTVLGNFVLPMLYGFLGATTAVVLSIQNKLRHSCLAPREKRMSQVQLVLGIIVGACIGLFMSPSAPDAGGTAGAGGGVTAGGSVALSASALSFLAGFGVESVFRMLQNMLQAMFGGETAAQPPPAPAPRPPA